MLDDQPIIQQIDEMVQFMSQYLTMYIYGAEQERLILRKYIHSIWNDRKVLGDSSRIPLCEIISLLRSDMQVGCIILERDQNIWLEASRELPKDFYILSEFNLERLIRKLSPKPALARNIEISLAEHCNLNCSMCDHYAPLAEEKYYPLDQFSRDLERLSALMNGRIGDIVLMGGEPLLNPGLLEYLQIARKNFPETLLILWTNGLLLQRWETHENGNLWQLCHDLGISIFITRYPISLDAESIELLSIKYQVEVKFTTNAGDLSDANQKMMRKDPLILDGSAPKWQYACCYHFNECSVLKEGRIYPCPQSAHSDIFNRYFGKNLDTTSRDYLNLYEVASYEEIAEFLSKRVPFCDYCHISARREGFPWNTSRKVIEEYVDFPGF